MGRNRRYRMVQRLPEVTLFKPQGVPARQLQILMLPIEGLEALRLVDAEGLSQAEAAERMNISRPTLNRVLAEARIVVAQALSNGCGIRIEGGNFQVASEPIGDNSPKTGFGPGAGGRRGRGRGCGNRRRFRNED